MQSAIVAVTGAARAYSSRRQANVLMYSVQYHGNAALKQPNGVEAAEVPGEALHTFLMAQDDRTISQLAMVLEAERGTSYVAVPAAEDHGVRIIVPGSTCYGYQPIPTRAIGKTQWATPDMQTIYRFPMEHRALYEEVTHAVAVLFNLALSFVSPQLSKAIKQPTFKS